MTASIEVRGIGRNYDGRWAVRGLDLTIAPGELYGFLGPNGAGKTTTLKLLSGVINPTRGSALVMGHVPWKRENAYRRRFALVMGQKNQLWWDLPAQESFRLHQQIYRIEPAGFQRTLDELADLLDIRRLLRQPVRELSLGERMKMELAAALLLLTSHYMKDIAALCQRVVIIAGGRIVYDGALADIVGQFSGHKLVALQLSGEDAGEGLEQFGTVLERTPPRVRLRIERHQVAKALAAILARHAVEDVAVEDPPLEEVIAELFAKSQVAAAAT